ncbi:DNA recombination protein RmuC [Marasmitruncus massiliensis]|uniref:DNA recombination protein RmuC n=1 Tax=Marasmitruncus massiliensis TaxID=1944642 RepID=UPI000C7E629A|nr:DNA recombination protein RmuC [Marasmitruncus massiliensis]
MEPNSLIWLLLCIGLLSFAATAAALIAVLHIQRKQPDMRTFYTEISRLREDLLAELRQTRQENNQNISRTVTALGQSLTANQSLMTTELSGRQESTQKSVILMMRNVDQRIQGFTVQNEQQLTGIRNTVEKRLQFLQEDNARRLDEMRATVDEKLQQTLETRIGKSFQLVSDRLEQVYRGLGEMQSLAAGVGDLKKVLSNVKTRGILGEVQLGAILEQILSPEQYKANVATKRGSRAIVEYAVVLPGDGEQPVYLPIDAKFPADAYTQLTDAYEKGNAEGITVASALLSSRIKSFAKDIRDKYLDPPYTTDFAIMFLPFEGLYAQVLRLNLLEILQRDYKVNIAGPTTMAALLNSLQMGFQTLAIQKRSSEVWDVLGAVKTEFDRFGEVLDITQQRLEQANHELDKLVGVRTRMIRHKLAQISAVSSEKTEQLLKD